ncbi:MAG: YfhO family protein [Thermodesulfobacteriota bacterium]
MTNNTTAYHTPDPHPATIHKHTLKAYLWCALAVCLSIGVWFADYIIYGYTFLSEAGQMLWADWVMARNLLTAPGSTAQWNPWILLGVNYGGREAFLNPYNLGTLLGLVFSDDKFAFMGLTMFFLAAMGFTMFAFLRSLGTDTVYALVGVVMYTLAPKWVDDAYHGPRFIISYALLPILMLLIKAAYDAGFRRFRHFVGIAVCVALMYLSTGAPFLLMNAYLFVAFFAYLLFLHLAAAPNQLLRTVTRTLLYSVLCLAIFAALIAYIFLPFLTNYFSSQRSLYAEPIGFVGQQYLGFIFPWIDRIFVNGLYDLPYPSPLPFLYPNLYFYVGILAVPVVLYALAHRAWNWITAFFLFFALAWLILWNSLVIKIFPLFPWIEKLTQGTTSLTHGHINFIFCFAVIVSFVLSRIAASRQDEPSSSATRADRCLGWLNLSLIALYMLAVIVMVSGILIYNTGLKSLFWHKINNSHHILVYYYFGYAALTFLAMFLIRGAIIWIYHRRYFVRTWGSVLLLIFVIADFELCFRTWYPFTDMDDRYRADLPQNAFVRKKTEPLDRLGAPVYQAYGPSREQWQEFLKAPADQEPAALLEKFARLYYKGYVKPLYEPSFSWYPLTVGRSFFNFHESIMPDYFWDFDKALNKNNPRYSRQSWVGLWDPTSRLADVAGIKYIFWDDEVKDERLIEVENYDNGKGFGRIYLNPHAVPRAYIVNRVELFKDRGQLLLRMAERDYNPLEAATTEDARLAQLMESGNTTRQSNSNVGIDAYLPDQVRLTVETRDRALLVLTDLYYPNWTATVNGQPTTIYRVNCLFRGIVVPGGRSEVIFRYYDWCAHVGLIASIAGWIFVVSYLVISGFYCSIRKHCTRAKDIIA